MESSRSELRAKLGFTRRADVFPDSERAGLLRARTLQFGVDPADSFDSVSCAMNDCTDPQVQEPGLLQAGFQTVDLSGNAALQRALALVRDEDRISDSSANAIRASLEDARLRLTNDSSLRIEHVADEGMIHRRAGPNQLDVNPGGMNGANGHGAAQRVHGDQDVFGTPLKQMMNGAAPKMFRHITPDARNDDSTLLLLNMWIPLQQITRPLVLMDRRTLDAKRHQLRYALPVTRFLDRDEESSVNDIWTFLPDPAQKWYFRSRMGPDQAYVFDTLGEPHGACILPGEEALEQLYRNLDRSLEAAARQDAQLLREIAAATAPTLPEITTEPIRDAWRRMTELLREAGSRAAEICASRGDWRERVQTEMDAVVRKSIELRLVATLIPDGAAS